MKCLLLAPARYPFIKSIEQGLAANGITLKTVDYLDFFSPRVNGFVNKYTALPKRIKSLWEDPYTKSVNATYLEIFNEFQPDLVFIYNNQLVLPGLLESFRKKARVAFMLGDNPLYTPTSIYNLHILFNADHIISPDTLWAEQLTRMGIRNVHFDSFGFDPDTYFPMEVGEEDFEKLRSDFIYVGSASKTNWGYKRALFLDHFKNFDLKAYISGEGMERWFDFFPGLGEKIIPHDRFDAAFNNLVYNYSKIAPVEQVPSLFNGIHVRVFDILGSGILPLCEYSPDFVEVFEGIDVPVIENYADIPGVATFWLENEAARKACVRSMRERVLERHAPQLVIRRMLLKIMEAETCKPTPALALPL